MAGRLTIIGGGVMGLMTAYQAFIPPPGSRAMFTGTAMPVFGYLDIGIYGHPVYDGKTPGLRDAEVVDVAAASGVDTCWYDRVTDDEFILGAVPGAEGLYTGVGWRGSGYKFAPWVGRVLAQPALQRGTVYDIGRFTPARFTASEGVAP